MTQILWLNRKREAMNENQEFRRGEMLLLNVYSSWSMQFATNRKFIKFSWNK